MENLILASAFDSFGCKKRELLWQLGLLEKKHPGELPLEFQNIKVSLPDFTEIERMKVDYEVEGFPLKYHPMQLLRKDISRDGLLKIPEATQLLLDTKVPMAGYVITKQRPATAKGFAFIIVEDAGGTVNVVVKPNVYQKCRQTFRFEPIVVVEGIIQKREGILNTIADRILPLDREKDSLLSMLRRPANRDCYPCTARCKINSGV